jgi:hemerythrin
MTFIGWRHDYRVGVLLIDSEHEYLFGLVNAFHDSYAGGGTRPQILLVLNRQVAYAEEHLRHEEALMGEAGYPRLPRQHELHEKLVSPIFELNQKRAAGEAMVDA